MKNFFNTVPNKVVKSVTLYFTSMLSLHASDLSDPSEINITTTIHQNNVQPSSSENLTLPEDFDPHLYLLVNPGLYKEAALENRDPVKYASWQYAKYGHTDGAKYLPDLPEDFDPRLYLLVNPGLYKEAALENRDPVKYAIWQYAKYGHTYGAKYLPEDFDPRLYLLVNPGLYKEAAFEDRDPVRYASWQYAKYGHTYGAKYLPDLPEDFDPRLYLLVNPGLYKEAAIQNIDPVKYATWQYAAYGHTDGAKYLPEDVKRLPFDYLTALGLKQKEILEKVERNRPQRLEELKRKEEKELRERESRRAALWEIYVNSVQPVSHPGPTATILLEELSEIVIASATRDPQLRLELIDNIEQHKSNRNDELWLNYEMNHPMRQALYDTRQIFKKLKIALVEDAQQHDTPNMVNFNAIAKRELENSERKRGDAILEYLEKISATNFLDTGSPISDILDRVPLGYLHHDIREKFYRTFKLPVVFNIGRTEKSPANNKFYFKTEDGYYIPISEKVAVRHSTDPDLANALGNIPPDTFITADVRRDVLKNGIFFEVIVLDLTPIKID